jgi:hypothetical protein
MIEAKLSEHGWGYPDASGRPYNIHECRHFRRLPRFYPDRTRRGLEIPGQNFRQSERSSRTSGDHEGDSSIQNLRFCAAGLSVRSIVATGNFYARNNR